MNTCPLGIVDTEGACDFRQCPNKGYCWQQTRPWPLPFSLQLSEGLQVKVDCILEDARDLLSCQYPKASMKLEAEQRLLLFERWAWDCAQHGWQDAFPLPYIWVDGTLIVTADREELGFGIAISLNWKPDHDGPIWDDDRWWELTPPEELLPWQFGDCCIVHFDPDRDQF